MDETESPGALLRRVYYREVNARDHTNLGKNTYVPYDGGTAASGRNYKCKWNIWAERITASNIDIEDYCQVMCSEMSDTTPEKLFSAKAIEIFLKIEGQLGKSLRLHWDSEERILVMDIERRVRQGQSVEDALNYSLFDTVLQITSLTRYSFAEHNNALEASEFYMEDAYEQYRRHYRIYDRECPERIPAKFRERIKKEHG